MTFNWNQSQINRLIQMLEAHMLTFGYEACNLPVLEDADLFLIRAGDQIVHSLFSFEYENRFYALRPEFTTPAAYLYGHMDNGSLIRRWQFNGPIFQNPLEQHGLPNQRLSMGAELIGDSSVAADAEIIAMAVGGIEKLGVETNRLIRLGHVGLTKHLLSQFKVDPRITLFVLQHTQDFVAPRLGKNYVYEKILQLTQMEISDNDVAGIGDLSVGRAMGGRTVAEIAARLRQKRVRADSIENIVAMLNFMELWVNVRGPFPQVLDTVKEFISKDDSAGISILTNIEELSVLLGYYGLSVDNLEFQPAFTRSWDYYTGIVFEVLINNKVIAGGGRYDELQRLIGGSKDVPSVGFAYEMDQLIQQIIPSGFPVNEMIYITSQSDNILTSAISIAQRLRSEGQNATLGTPPGNSASIQVVINSEGKCEIYGSPTTSDNRIAELKRKLS
jgi:ATP phosphoribosyltransferase regulatory subunit